MGSNLPPIDRPEKGALHPRNKHPGRYDFEALIAGTPALKPFVAPNPYGDLSIDFSNPIAVRTLNRALLKNYYGLEFWEIPDGFLCPPIPGRADYLHNLADLLAHCNDDVIPTGPSVRVLDVGIGASAIYPIIGTQEYGWSFVGSDTDPAALASSEKILSGNPELKPLVELRRQKNPEKVFTGIIGAEERFDLTLCNPPFHASSQEAQAGSRRKWHNLGRDSKGTKHGRDKSRTPLLNFGGQDSELWCQGGETAFITRMIDESRAFAKQVYWFTTLVSKGDSLEQLYALLERAEVADSHTLEMSQGQKKSRVLAWTFLDENARAEWTGGGS